MHEARLPGALEADSLRVFGGVDVGEASGRGDRRPLGLVEPVHVAAQRGAPASSARPPRGSRRRGPMPRASTGRTAAARGRRRGAPRRLREATSASARSSDASRNGRSTASTSTERSPAPRRTSCAPPAATAASGPAPGSASSTASSGDRPGPTSSTGEVTAARRRAVRSARRSPATRTSALGAPKRRLAPPVRRSPATVTCSGTRSDGLRRTGRELVAGDDPGRVALDQRDVVVDRLAAVQRDVGPHRRVPDADRGLLDVDPLREATEIGPAGVRGGLRRDVRALVEAVAQLVTREGPEGRRSRGGPTRARTTPRCRRARGRGRERRAR